MVVTSPGRYTLAAKMVTGIIIAARRLNGGEIMQNGQKKGYEYELCIARLDTKGRAIRVSSIDLSKNSAFVFGGGFGFCGLGICSIQTKPGRKTEKASGIGAMPFALL
jgi:hypothetical protein